MMATAISRPGPERRESRGYRFLLSRGNFSILGLLVLLAFATVCGSLETSWAQSSQNASQEQLSELEKASYAEALAYCRKNAASVIALADDKQVLCISDWIFTSFDFWTAYGLAQGGVAVVRSSGGEIVTTTKLADLLLSKQATVVINDYCLANCANYLFIASLKTFVPKDSLVAWVLPVMRTNAQAFRRQMTVASRVLTPRGVLVPYTAFNMSTRLGTNSISAGYLPRSKILRKASQSEES